MRVIGIATSFVCLALAAPLFVGCGSADDQGKQEEELGSLNLSLTGTSASGVNYRLRTATFVVTGSSTINLSSETDPNAASIRQELAAGQYLVRLKNGWSMEKETGGVFAPVRAVLVSPNPRSFEILDQGVTPVVFGFKAGDDVVELGNGTLDLSISVDDNSCPAGTVSCNGACVDVNGDPNNCGACANVCGSPGICQNGVCNPLFTFSGVAQNLPIASLTGWSQCYTDLYLNSGTPLTDILSACGGSQLMLACRLTGADVLTIAAQAPRDDVLFDVGTDPAASHEANGVAWYFSQSWSWGFAPAGEVVNRSSCDFDFNGPQAQAESRLCWHTFNSNIDAGFRCGADTFLNGSQDWERLVFQVP